MIIFLHTQNVIVHNKMTRILIFILFATSLFSCTSKYKIDGKTSVSRLDGKMIYLCMMNNEATIVDSAEIIHGTFKMSGDVDSTMMLMMFMDDNPITPIVLEDGNISIDLSYSDVYVRGTELNDKLCSFITRKKEYDNQMSVLDSKLAKRVLSGDDYDMAKSDIKEECDSLCSDYDAYIENFIRANYDNVLSSGVFTLICYSTPVEILPKSFFKLFKEAPESFRSNPLVLEYAQVFKDFD